MHVLLWRHILAWTTCIQHDDNPIVLEDPVINEIAKSQEQRMFLYIIASIMKVGMICTIYIASFPSGIGVGAAVAGPIIIVGHVIL